MDSTFIAPKVSDNSLMSSMMSRLTAVEKQLSEAEAKLKEKVGCISAFLPNEQVLEIQFKNLGS